MSTLSQHSHTLVESVWVFSTVILHLPSGPKGTPLPPHSSHSYNSSSAAPSNSILTTLELNFMCLTKLKWRAYDLIGLEKQARRPTCQAQRRGAPHEISKPLGASAKRRPSPIGPKGRPWITGEAHILQIRFNSANTENRINNILSCQSNQISSIKKEK